MRLELDDLHVRYGRVHALRGVSLAVEAGEIVAVLGANGAGKSSLLKAIIGLVPASAGRIAFDGADMTHWPPSRRVRRNLVLVPEGRRIIVSLTVHENLLMGAFARNDMRAVEREIAGIYDRFPNLAARRHLPAAVLSGGEQQMLAIGRGLLADPTLMMLDEPSLGLSPRLTNEVFALVRELNRSRGLAILLVEQNTHKALELADRACVLELGRKVMEGRPRELRDDPSLRDAYLGRAGQPAGVNTG
ncbi:MAG TPA: ABC transporter ATP-binding protein [Xanthobacteraceae bacterium]|jgi:branched-chain amino acid transport system ATP-binding protein